MLDNSISHVYFKNLNQVTDVRQTNREWLKSRDFVARETGVAVLRGKLARIAAALELNFKKFAATLDAEEVHLPSSLSISDLKRSGTLANFGHLLFFSSSLAEGASPLEANLQDHLAEPARACCSAVCLPVYPCYENQTFRSGQNVCLTALGRCFRNEKLDPANPERLNEFQMREIIFLGSEEFVIESLERCKVWMKSFLTEFRLRGVIQSAEDPFFPAQADALGFYQRIRGTKLELCLEKPEESALVAVASLNNHENHFAKSYNIRLENGDYIHSACFGFGIERALFLILYQYGLDDSKWPACLRELIFGQ